MNYTINETISLINKKLDNKTYTFDVREHLMYMYKYNGEIVNAFRKEDKNSLKSAIGNLFVSLILISNKYNVDCNSLDWDDEGIDISKGYTGFHKEMILLNSVIGSLSDEVYAIEYVGINSDISNVIEGMLEKLSNISHVTSISFEQAAYLGYENWSK